MGSRARQPTGRQQREVPPRFAKLNQNRQPPKSNTNGRHLNNGTNNNNNSALCNDHQSRKPRYKIADCQSEAEPSFVSAATRKQIENTRMILSKLTFDNSDDLAWELDQLQLRDDWYVVTEVAKLIYEKAVDADCVELTRSCAKLVYQFVSHQQSVQWALAKNLRKQLLDSCQQEFQKTRSDPAAVTAEQEFEEASKVKRKIGNARLLGEFYKLQWLTPRIMVEMVQTLLGRKDQTGRNCQESLYQLFELLVSVGEELENQLEEMSWRHQKEGVAQRFVPEPNWMDRICGQIKELEDDQRLADDTRLAMAILLKLRRHKWNWDIMKLDQRTSNEVLSRMTTTEESEPHRVQPELVQQEDQTFSEDFNVATSNRYQFLRSPPPADPIVVYGQLQSQYCGPTFFVPVALENAVEVPHSPLLDQRPLLIPVPNDICSQIQDEEAQSQLEFTDTQSAEAILHHYLATNNFENAEDLILRELHETDGLEKLISSVVELVIGATSDESKRRGAAELIKALVESDRNSWTFKDIVAAVQKGVMQDISTTVEERPKAALHLTAFMAEVFSDQPRF